MPGVKIGDRVRVIDRTGTHEQRRRWVGLTGKVVYTNEKVDQVEVWIPSMWLIRLRFQDVEVIA